MNKLKELKAMMIINSIGKKTIMVKASTSNNQATAIVPGGNSKGIHEARTIEVSKAIKRIKILNNKLKGVKLEEVDSLITREAGNVSTGISLAVKRLIAKEKKVELFELFNGNTLPIPHFNIINGGVHAGNKLSFQEYMIAPIGHDFKESYIIGVNIYQSLRDYLKKNFGAQAINVGFEGGFAPSLSNVEEPLKIITKIINKLGYEKNVKLAIDAAASQFYNKSNYLINGVKFSTNKLIDYYEKLVNDYPLISIEDPFHEEDFKAFSELNNRLRSKKIRIVGDDLTVSNTKRITTAIKNDSCNSLLLKINQVGTVNKAIESANMAFNNKWSVMVSHRSGDSCDPFIADFTVGINAGLIKAGAPNRGERVAKYNRLLEIESLLGNKAIYPKKQI